jgi:ribosomal protein L19
MEVTHLRQFLTSLETPLRVSGGAKVADELKAVVDGLVPFQSMSLRDFQLFLLQAEEYHRTGILPVPPTKGGRKPKAPKPSDEELIKEVASQVVRIRESAMDESQSYEGIERQVEDLLKKPTKPILEKIAREVGLSRKFKTKKDVVDAIVVYATNARYMAERTSF